jgi:hypothetical protein
LQAWDRSYSSHSVYNTLTRVVNTSIPLRRLALPSTIRRCAKHVRSASLLAFCDVVIVFARTYTHISICTCTDIRTYVYVASTYDIICVHTYVPTHIHILFMYRIVSKVSNMIRARVLLNDMITN